MEKYELQRLRELPVEEVAERLGLRVSRHKSLCPFHDDSHPSLSYNIRRNGYRCFVCDAHGGTIDLVMNSLHKDFKDACRWLTDVFFGGISTGESVPPRTTAAVSPEGDSGGRVFDASRYVRFFEHPWLSEAARLFLFDERRIDPRVVRWCRLTSWRDRWGVDWLQIPYFDTEGKLIGVQNRRLTRPQAQPQPSPGGEGSYPVSCNVDANFPPPSGGAGGGASLPRFRFPYGSHCSIYNMPVVKRLVQGDDLYITEGCSDCWAMLSSGHKAIAIPSATLLSEEDKRWLVGLSERSGVRWHMYPDQDAPGERLFMQLRTILPDIQHHHLPPGCKDFGEYYKAPPQEAPEAPPAPPEGGRVATLSPAT